jgi:hypothetical protein
VGKAVSELLLEWRHSPLAFVTTALRVEPDVWQREALEAIVTHDRLAIRSGHGVGKSAFLAWVMLWWLLTRMPAKVACTAPTAHQLSDVLWGELAKWRRALPRSGAAMLALKCDRLELRYAPGESFAVARTSRREQPEAFQGFHSEHMLFVVDEASGVEEAIFEVGEGAMSTPGAKTVLAGNPTRGSGYFYEAFHRRRAHWWTRRVSCLESCHATAAFAAGMAERYGAESNIYRVRVLGEFPVHEDDKVIPLAWCEAAVRRDVKPLERYRSVWGVDVARFGDDRSALAKRNANRLVEPVKWWRGKDTMQLAGLIAHEYDACAPGEAPAEIMVDVIGLGAGVVDRLKELGLPVRGVAASEAPATEDKYLRKHDELWWKAREWFEAADVVMPEDAALIAELTAPKYSFTSAGKLRIESKDEMKKRGVPSPDLADAFCLTFAGRDVRIELRGARYIGQARRGPKTFMGV